MEKDFKNKLMIPLAIVLAGLLILGGMIYSNQLKLKKEFKKDLPVKEQGKKENSDKLSQEFRLSDQTDHWFGNLEAPLTIIEYSDFQCPFCARVHATLKKIVEEFKGKVKWVWRHFPLTQIHSQALPAALASECVAELGGNENFWLFADKVFEQQSQMSEDLFRQIVKDLNLDLKAFDDCFNSQKYLEKIQKDAKEAINSGAQGTPFSLIVSEKGEVVPISGALPFENFKEAIEKVLK
jgi:protein-disulfide isomerase